MRFGLFGGATAKRGQVSGDSQGYQGLVDIAVEVEDLGYHSLFLVEHHFSGTGQLSASLNMLSYLAALTKKIRLGTAVTVLPWHNPVLLAEQAASVDVLSGGRLDFGVGKGYRDIEYHGFNIDRQEALDMYDESMEVILKSWTSEERFDHKGKYWQFNDILVEPPTVQTPHPPFWSAAGTDESIARVAKSGFNVLFDNFASLERTAERMQVWRDTCAEIGRPFDPMQVGLTRWVNITNTPEEYEAAVEARERGVSRMFGKYGALPGQEARKAQPDTYADPDMSMDALIGNPDQIIDRLSLLESMGFEYLLILMPDSIEPLRRFAQEVMPAFEKRAANAAQ